MTTEPVLPPAPSDTSNPTSDIPAQVAPNTGPPQIVISAPDLGFLKRPAITALLGYLAILLGAILAAVIASSAIPDNSVIPGGITTKLPFLLAGMALLSPLQASASAGGGLASGAVELTVIPLTLTLLGLAAVWVITATRTPAGPNVKARWRDAAVTGGALGILAAIVAALVKVTADVGSDLLSAGMSTGVKPFEVLAGGFLIGTLGSALGFATVNRRLDLSRIGIRVPILVSRSIVNVLSGGLIVSAAATVVALIVGFVKIGFGATIGLFLTVLPNALVYVFTIGSFGSISLTGDLATSSRSTGNLFTADAPALWVTFALVVLAVLIAATRGLLASGRRDWQGWWVTPSVLAAGTVVALLVTRVSFSGSGDAGFLGSAEGGGGLQVAWTAVLIAAAWGLVIEGAERYAAPYVIGLIPALPGLYARVTKQEPAVAGAALPAVNSRKAKLVGFTVLGIAVVVGLGLGARAIVQATVFSPNKPVEAYVKAIQSGDVDGAFKLADADVPNAQRTLLTNDVYGKVESRPTGGTITKVEEVGDSAYVTVESKQDGATIIDQYTLTKRGHQLLVFDKWVLAAPAIPTVQVGDKLPYDVDKFTVNGLTVERTSDGAMTFRALPGLYTVSLPVEPLLTSGDFTVLVGGNGEATVQGAPEGFLSYQLTAEATAKGQQLGSDYAKGCMAAKTITVPACFLTAYVYGDNPRDATWTLDKPVKVETFAAGGPNVQVHVAGTASVAGTVSSTDWWTNTVSDKPFTDDRVYLDVWLMYTVDGDTWSLTSFDDTPPVGD